MMAPFCQTNKDVLRKNWIRLSSFAPAGTVKQIAAPGPGGEQQMLAIGRAADEQAEISDLDEPSIGIGRCS